MDAHNNLGLIADERMRGIPKKLRRVHEATFYFHDRLVEAIREVDKTGPRTISIDVPQEMIARLPSLSDMDAIELLRAIGQPEKAKAIILGECVLALTVDALLFLQEALFAYEKGKLRVSLSLLRKPMKENLLYLEWILADEDDFLAAFAHKNRKVLSIDSLTPDRRKQLIAGAIAKCSNSSFLEPDVLYDTRYNKAANGLEPLWQKSQHLITAQSAHLLTEIENFNFIFIQPEEEKDLYEQVWLSYLMLTIHFYDVVCGALSRSYRLHEGAQSYDAFCKLAAMSLARGNLKDFHNVAEPFVAILNEHARCDCGARPKVSAKQFARLLFTHKLQCESCGEDGDFDTFEDILFSESS